ncbi:MAG: flagellar basal body protein, partial [Fimbriimonadaceae bacterium]
MPSAFSGIEMASRALRVFQRGLDVVGHNVSNVNTRGYSRQTVEYATTTPLSFFDMRRLTIGSGVGISSINRIRDGLLDQRLIAAQSEGGRFGALKASLGRIEPVFNEPGDAGISAALDRF